MVLSVERHTCQVRSHGSFQLELKLEYRPTQGTAKRDDYEVDLYLFTPPQLGMGRGLLTTDLIFADLVSYTRYRTPRIELARLASDDCEASPLRRIRDALGTGEDGEAVDADLVLYELRTLVNIYRAQTRDRRHAIRDGLGARTLSVRAAERAMRQLLEDADTLRRAFRGVEPLFLNAGIAESLRQGYAWADEILSIRTEKNAIRLEETARVFGLSDELRAACQERVASCEKHRRARGYLTVVVPGEPRQNEVFVYRDGLLKKWAQSAMYMTMAPSRTLKQVANFLFGVAAALAMAFAVLASVLATRWFPANSLSWALLAVLAYVFKDRIKDGLRAVFLKAIPRLVAHRVQHLVDPRHGQKVGTTRERVRFPTAEEIPLDVRRLRYTDSDPLRALSSVDDLLHYQKSIRVDTQTLFAHHTRVCALAEVLRLDLRRWSRRMDEPQDRLVLFDGDARQELVADRVYHVAAVVSVRSGGEVGRAPSLYRYRVVMNRLGILRVEAVGSSILV